MFNVLFGFLKWLWDSLYFCITKVVGQTWYFIGLQWTFFGVVVGAILSVLSMAFSLLNVVDTALTGAITSATGAGGSMGSSTALAYVNFVFPLNETFVMVVAYINITGALILYRFIKSWLPKILGTGFGS